MALDNAALLEVLEALKAADVEDRIRTAAETIYQELIDAELTAFIGAAPCERTDAADDATQRARPRTLTTTAGDLELRIPKLRTGSFFPSLLERRRRVDQALFAVVMEAYVHGVSHPQGRRPGQGARRRHRDLQVRGVADLRRPRRGGRRVPGPVPGRDRLPVRVPRRHLLQGPGRPAGGVPGGRGRDRRHRRRAPRGARLRRRRHRGRRVLDRVPARP